jgi:hypothetical protein
LGDNGGKTKFEMVKIKENKITKWKKPLVFMQEKGWFFDQSEIFNA